MGLIIRKMFLLLAPLLIVGACYLLFDPFEVVYHPSRHYLDPQVVYNWDVNQTEILEQAYSSYRFDSYILGSSRSKAFMVEDWRPCIDSPRVFHYAVMAETLFGIERKIAFIDRNRMPLRNVLLILDRDILGQTGNSTGHLFIKHPDVSGGSRLDFHLTFFQAFMGPTFFFPYLAHRLGLPLSVTTKALVTGGKGCRYDPILGDMTFVTVEEQIRKDPGAFYRGQQRLFYPRSGLPSTAPPVVGVLQRKMLASMAKIFAAHRTDVRVVIAPLYDQVTFNPADRRTLEDFFGKERVFDFSGINTLTSGPQNYLEPSHFRPHVARAIISTLYEKSCLTSP